MTQWLLGLDDTDVPGSRGTGRLARALADALAARGARVCGVTRHQLLVDPRVPYTSHNSANCLLVEAEGGAEVFAWACRFVAERSPEGADPGVCLAEASAVNGAAVEFGRRAQRHVLRRREAEELAAAAGHRLAGLGGTRDGVIGALAAVGLRAGGNDGRFIALGRLRELPHRVQARDLLSEGVHLRASAQPVAPRAEDWVETLGWARPRLLDGRAVLLVERSNDDGVEWIVADRRRGDGSRGLH